MPRAHEARIEKRYHAAVAQVQHHADVARRAAGLALAGAVRDKLRLIQALENALVNPDAHTHAADWRQRWDAMLPLEVPYDKLLHARFEAALHALEGDRAGYARQLEANRERLLHDLLKLEIAAGIDSGPEFARDRLKLQVEVLQSSLKSGQKPGAHGDALRQLLSVPALADARTETRIEQLLMRQAKDGK